MDFFQVSGKLRAPYIYIIFIDEYVYIGETQGFPVIRWSAHLGQDGTLVKKLTDLNFSIHGDTQINFLAFNLSDYFDVDLLKNLKRSTQAVEDELHVRLACTPSVINHSIIISNTEKTAPSRFRHWSKVNLIVDCIIESLKLRKKEA